MYYLYSGLLLLTGLFSVNFIYGYQSKHIDPHFWATLKYQLLVLPLFLFINLCIGYGIKFGYKAIGNLSYVLVASKGLEILISLLIGFILLKEIPTWKTWIGLSLVLAGFAIAKIK
ncbi:MULTISPECIES: hypothetical protein [Paenibacillus]|uniref:Uncharacterized protein n=1 Tax=Paenibacillus naphthalenovorans TaxID=162209 RepID=A0A0U2UFF0_9BACL|nr:MULTISPECIES: hypothetical protein [Paenibacillus]ALS21916.1 hypothetical protein IJ22_15400 [Paenibacillus naphthalenovorans]NTZ16652.1 hypothetical protein [Paenibacillus sp. JMULE4]GCL71645.1 hypothetical protein PN4B1_15500 [Paenibacillus naphthalenovorans]SDJ47315.1 hypothetical protein SAMN05421868_12849 [Paenibacillus naphthalenovorans]